MGLQKMNQGAGHGKDLNCIMVMDSFSSKAEEYKLTDMLT